MTKWTTRGEINLEHFKCYRGPEISSWSAIQLIEKSGKISTFRSSRTSFLSHYSLELSNCNTGIKCNHNWIQFCIRIISRLVSKMPSTSIGYVTNIPKLSPIGSVSLLLDRCIHSLFIRVFNSEKSFVELTFGCFKLNYTFWFRSKSISQNHFQSCIFGSVVKYYEKSWLFAISCEFQGFNNFLPILRF